MEYFMATHQNNGKRFAYFYFNRDEPERIRQVVPAHVQYWKTAGMDGYTGGPFADRSGGLITFSAANQEEATGIILQDPFIQQDLIADKWIKEWIVE
jgi:uncharacterized protein YciI